MIQMDLLFKEPQAAPPPPRPAEPAIWIARLLILREPKLTEASVIRDIRMRRGLNVLWAPPSPAGEGNRLFEGTLTGHTAGKSTFCRLIRYLLGEERFGTTRTQDRIRAHARLRDGWIAGEVLLRAERWVVGRPFAKGLHPFASRSLSMEEALETREGYQDFLAALTAATVAGLPVQTLPHARRPIDWPLVLTWLARDQEARFSDVVAWRDARSESGSPSPKVADRHVAVRAILDLMSDKEADLLQKHESLKQAKKQMDDDGFLLRQRAEEDRHRLATLLGQSPEDVDAGPLFADKLRERIASDRATLERDEGALHERQAAVELALQASTRAAEERAVRQVRLRDIEEDSQGAPRGRCNVPLAIAAERGCPLAAPELMRDIGRDLEQTQIAATQAYEEADAAFQEHHGEYMRRNAELHEERARLARRRASIEEMARVYDYSCASQDAAQVNEDAHKHVVTQTDELSKQKAARQRGHAEALGRLSARFEEVVQGLLGRGVSGRVDVSGGEIDLHIAQHGERDGAAMETLKVLAFDLAALSLSIEGHGHLPGLLIHDGPREADMDETIYERLFLYAEDLERRSPGAPGFQYIVTTTAPPPVRLQEAPWLLDPKLDASTPEGRLLRMDL